MQTNIKPGEVKNIQIQGETISGLQFLFNEVFSDTTLDAAQIVTFEMMSKIKLKGTLTRAGRRYILFNENIADLMRYSNFYSLGYIPLKVCSSDPDVTTNHNVTTLAAINFSGILDIKGTDKLEIEIDFPTDAYTEGTNISLNYLTIATIEAIGYEYFIPIIKSYVLSANEPAVSRNLGNNINRIAFISREVTNAMLKEHHIIEQVWLNSDKFVAKEDTPQLIAKRLLKFEDSTTAFARNHSFIIFEDDVNLDEVFLDFIFDPQNLSAGKNRIMWTEHFSTPQILAKAAAQEEVHNIENAVKLGVPLTSELANAKNNAEAIKSQVIQSKEEGEI